MTETLANANEMDSIAQEIAVEVRAWIARNPYDLIIVRDYPRRSRFTEIMKIQAHEMVRALHRALHPIALQYDFDCIDVWADDRRRAEDMVILRREHVLAPPEVS